jgi:predicted transcriptional regulator YheO
MDLHRMEMLKQIARGIAAHFGPNCEVVIHDLAGPDGECAIAHIENGHVTGRRVGDGPSKVVVEQLLRSEESPQDQLSYLTRTPDGKILKSSTIYIRDNAGKVDAILSINYDISALLMIENALGGLVRTADRDPAAPAERISVLNVNDLLEDLIEQSVALAGKPVALMTKDDKVRAIQFLSRHGAFLITKSGDKVAKYFGISKYTLYSYIDIKQQEEKRHEQDRSHHP